MPEKDVNINPVEWGKLLSKIDNMHDDIKEIKAKVEKQNCRVRKLEIWRGYIIGIALGGAAVISFLLNKILR